VVLMRNGGVVGGAHEKFTSARDAAVWLSNRVQAYSASPKGMGRYFNFLHKFLENRMYEMPDEAWVDREEEPQGPSWSQQTRAKDRNGSSHSD